MATGSLEQLNAIEEERLRAACRFSGDGQATIHFYLPSMHCGGCMKRIERGLSELPFVAEARANLSLKRASITWDPDGGNATDIANRINELGFEPRLFTVDAIESEKSDPIGRRLLMSVAVAGFATANIMLLSVSVWSGADHATQQLFHLISGLIAIPAVAFAGRPFFVSAIKALRHNQLNMDVPISLAVLLAIAMSLIESIRGGENVYFDASAMLLFFLLIGRYLDHLMRERARGAVKQLSQLASKGAVVRQADGSTRFVPSGDVGVGMTVVVAPGERFPIDGVVTAGRSDIDRSLVTGESTALTIGPGDTVEAGTLNLSGPMEIRSTKTADQSFLSEVVQMMEMAEQGKARFVRIADRVARIYAPAVHILAAVTFIGWMIHSAGDGYASISTAIAVLIITCPCALGLAVPIVQMVGAGRLFSDGVMVKDGAAFEKLAEVDTIVFDKTGTLTHGRPVVTAMSPAQAEDQSLALALAACSSHPASLAIGRYFSAQAVLPSDLVLADVREQPGLGIESIVSSRRVRLGRRDWVSEIASGLHGLENSDSSTVFFAREGQSAISFELEDTLRPDAAATIRHLQLAGIDVEILSGDAPGPVGRVAKQLGISAYASGLSPKEKIEKINRLQAGGRKVWMIGDGINDAPALAAAHLSMAPSSGSDVGRQAADLVFIHDSLAAVPFARHIATRVNGLVRQNFVLAIAYNCVAVPLAMLGYVTPLVAALAMSGSSILVVANSMRLHLGSHRGHDLPHMADGNTTGQQALQLHRPKFPAGTPRENAA